MYSLSTVEEHSCHFNCLTTVARWFGAEDLKFIFVCWEFSVELVLALLSLHPIQTVAWFSSSQILSHFSKVQWHHIFIDLLFWPPPTLFHVIEQCYLNAKYQRDLFRSKMFKMFVLYRKIDIIVFLDVLHIRLGPLIIPTILDSNSLDLLIVQIVIVSSTDTNLLPALPTIMFLFPFVFIVCGDYFSMFTANFGDRG